MNVGRLKLYKLEFVHTFSHCSSIDSLYLFLFRLFILKSDFIYESSPIAKKIEAVTYFETNTAKKYGCSVSTLYEWKQDYVHLNEQLHLDDAMQVRDRLSLPAKRHEKYTRLNKQLMNYFHPVAVRGDIVSRSIIIKEAMKLSKRYAKEINFEIYKEFNCSEGWLRSFLKRLDAMRIKMSTENKEKQHVRQVQQQKNFYKCDHCEITTYTLVNLLYHIDTEHQNIS